MINIMMMMIIVMMKKHARTFMERQSLNVFCRVFTYLRQRIYDVKDDLCESSEEERKTHVLILYFRYFAQTNLAATILLPVGSCHIFQNVRYFVVKGG